MGEDGLGQARANDRETAAVRPLYVVEPFQAFYLREYPAMVGLALVLSGSRLAAEDLAQEAFLAAWRQWERIGRYEQPVAWVRRVVANQATSAIRRRVAEAKALVRLAGRWQPEVGEPSATTAEVWSAVRALPRRQAQAVALHYLLGCPVSEVAATLDRSERTVKTYLHDARDAIGRRLGLSWEDLQ